MAKKINYGPLLDAWEALPNDVKDQEELSDLSAEFEKILDQIEGED